MNAHPFRCPGARVRAAGFTLIELMVALAVAAILLTVAVPSFSDSLLSARLGSYAGALTDAVQKARGEAIKRNAVLSVCASANGSDCAGSGSWEQGWIVLAGTTVLESRPALPTGYRLAERDGTLRLNFQPTGIGVTPAQFTACRATPVGRTARTITVSTTGLTTTTTSATSCP